MKRYIYRAEGEEGAEWAEIWRGPEISHALAEAMERLEVDHLSLFADGNRFYLYYECLREAVPPERLLMAAGERLIVWPGGETETGTGRRWAPMTDIFHYHQPVAGTDWRHSDRLAEPYGRLARLKPEEAASYIYHHYQYQEEKPGDGDKYGIIGLHESLLFFYSEQPATLEPATYEGKLNTSLKPVRWAEAMEPHFIPWTGVPAGQELWRKLELVLHAAFRRTEEETRCVIRYA
ncbi:hypothetical protein MJ257_04875 [Paenibacillus timonensis]|uniref:Uncharacterized protein n=1 Tax=Paenibacillus timonensis TaxID=225915 RepID=A0ABW3S9D3_9BACL|nr:MULTISPECIES: hypothetical protein [Paenibacillus]MCH1639422.1 hypothetical protein [Paenibacillus timonensis]MDU2243487.1 hypothetical protein [Paenibacillus sp.]